MIRIYLFLSMILGIMFITGCYESNETNIHDSYNQTEKIETIVYDCNSVIANEKDIVVIGEISVIEGDELTLTLNTTNSEINITKKCESLLGGEL